MLSSFTRAVRRIIRGIRRGRVLSYGEVALRAGRPGGARAVVRALHQLEDVPWWRVVRKGGTLAPEVAWIGAPAPLRRGTIQAAI